MTRGRRWTIAPMHTSPGGEAVVPGGWERGLDQLLTYLGGGGDIEPLLIGKLGPNHIGMIKELQWRKVLREAPLRPRYLDDPKALERLEEVRKGRSVLDLIDGDKR